MKLLNLFSRKKAKTREEPSFDTKSISDREFGLPLSLLMAGGGEGSKVDIVYACWRDKAESIGQLPIKLYRNSERVDHGRDWRILTQKPNDYMTMQGFLEMMVVSCERYGAFYYMPVINDRNSITEILPLRFQGNITPQMDLNGRVYYTYTTNDGRPVTEFADGELRCVKLFTEDGFTPVSPLRRCAQLFTMAHAQEETYNKLNTEGITSQLAVKTEKKITSGEQIERIRTEWNQFRGAKGVTKTPVLDDGLGIEKLNFSPEEMKLLESRQMTAKRLCAVIGVPIEKVLGADTSSVDWDSILESYMRDSLNPYLVRYETAMNLLLSELTNGRLRIKFNRKEFYQGSPKKLVEAVAKEFSMCGCSLAEMREDLGREYIEGSENIYAIDTNNLTLGSFEDLKEIQAQLYGERQQEVKPDE